MRIIVIAGPNGAGKSIFAAEYLQLEGSRRPFVNGDDIAAVLNPADPATAAREAGRLALRQMDAYVASETDFAIETTLSGRAYVRRIKGWQAHGYRVAIIYLRLPSADHAVRRVARRVRQGGHDIPEDVIRRRFTRSWTNFVDLYRQMADEWRVYDTSVRPPRLLEASAHWGKIREPQPAAAQAMVRRNTTTQVKTTDRCQRHQPTRRSLMAGRRKPMAAQPPLMNGRPGRFPKGEPSHRSVLAALIRAQERALAKVGEEQEKPPIHPPSSE